MKVIAYLLCNYILKTNSDTLEELFLNFWYHFNIQTVFSFHIGTKILFEY